MGYDNRNNQKSEFTGIKYLEKDFLRYEEEVKNQMPRYKTTGLHPDILVQAERGYVKIEKYGVHPVTKRPRFRWAILTKLDFDGKQVRCPADEHQNFLNQYEKWSMKKAGQEKGSIAGLEQLAEGMAIKHDLPIENAEELREALEG